jgi:HPt (histidine-containing phosphotransfer) domain-containing protein
MITTTIHSQGNCAKLDGRPSMTITTNSSTPPLLDHTVLERLRSDLDGCDLVWRVFVRNFITALPQRIEKLRVALTTGDAVGALDAVRSLKTASQMVGAERLATLAIHLEHAQREGRDSDPSVVLPRLAVDHLRRIKERAGQTSFALETHLKNAPGPRAMGLNR